MTFKSVFFLLTVFLKRKFRGGVSELEIIPFWKFVFIAATAPIAY